MVALVSSGPNSVEALESRTIDELAVGDAVEISRVVSADDILHFAEITGDFNPIHVNVEFAQQSRFGRIIAHGPVAMGLAGQIVGTRMPGLGTIALTASIRHLRPIFAEDRITTRAEIASVDVAVGNVTIALTWTNQEGKVVAEGETTVKPPREPVEAPET
jgi:acyl dehydratase